MKNVTGQGFAVLQAAGNQAQCKRLDSCGSLLPGAAICVTPGSAAILHVFVVLPNPSVCYHHGS
ncbi:MAG TPA: hypothetical protein VE959_03610 [Bryobacteraceae bacterium]|nr:hypothetical protein [Bryobacteraceae bacterium]